jgi:hypothetical protein
VRAGRRTPPLAAALAGLVIVIGPLAAAALVTTGRPAAPEDWAVEGIDAPASTDAPRCVREDPATVAAVRAAIVPGARVTATQVQRCPAAHDGLEVRYAGEVIGDLVPRRGGVWARINDDAYALELGPLRGPGSHAGRNTGMAVWLPDGLHEGLGPPGRHGNRGDVVLVTGTVRRADPADGGGLTLRARSLEVLAASRPVDGAADATLESVAIAAVAIAVVAIAAAWARGGTGRRPRWVSAGRAAPRARTTGTAARSGRRRSPADGHGTPAARGG